MSIEVVYLQNIFVKDDGQRCLHRSHITDIGIYDDWTAFATGFLSSAIHPSPATGKADAYGWCATLFEPSGEEDEVNERNERFGGRNRDVLAHRDGAHAYPQLSLFVADLDNHNPDRAMIEIDVVEAVLTALNLNHLLYTSFSHSTGKHKVRIVIPVSRWLTPDEAFTVFTVFNDALGFQLDGSIYDPGDFLYGPPLGSDIRFADDKEAIDVDHYIAIADQLPEESKNAVQRHASNPNTRPATAEEITRFKERFASTAINNEVSISNPRVWNPDWFKLADELYCGGSHWQTMIGLLAKAWVKSNGELSRGDMQTLQSELDLHWMGYLSTNYSDTELFRAVRDAMKQVGSSPFLSVNFKPTDRELRAALNRMKRKTK